MKYAKDKIEFILRKLPLDFLQYLYNPGIRTTSYHRNTLLCLYDKRLLRQIFILINSRDLPCHKNILCDFSEFFQFYKSTIFLILDKYYNSSIIDKTYNSPSRLPMKFKNRSLYAKFEGLF